MPDEVVIVDANGQEHVFPPGFDPQRAAAIVRGGYGPKPSEQPGATGRFIGPTKTQPITPPTTIGPWWNPIEVPHPATNPERHRPDNSIMGMPPELAVTGGIGLARGVGGAVANAAKAGTSTAVAAAKAAADNPVVRYEATRTTLKSLGVPDVIAEAIAFGVSGRGGKRAPATTAGDAANAAASSRMVTGMSEAAAKAPAAASAGMDAAKATSAVAAAAAKANATFSPAQTEAAVELVQQGLAPAKAVLSIKNAGKSLEAAKALAKMLGLPTDAEMAADIASRQYKR